MARGKTKQQVQAELNLDAPPDDELMGLLAELAQLGEGPVPSGPDAARLTQEYSPSQVSEELEGALVAESVGALIAKARAEARLSLGKVGQQLGVSRSRVGQLEECENIEVATLERVARTLGYRLEIHLEPLSKADRRALRLTLGSPPRVVAKPVVTAASPAPWPPTQDDSPPSATALQEGQLQPLTQAQQEPTL